MCSNKKKYTENQRKAVDNIETAMSVTANAGSGKTTVLVDRYIKILEEKCYDENSNSCDITKILAMTFTNKAAGEMKDRLIEYYNDKIDDEINKIKDSKAKEEDIKKYKIISSSLKYANIMTIHTFCNKLLSEYSFEIGMPPEIITLTDFQKNNIEKAAITKSVNNYLKNIENNNQYKEQLLNLYDVNKIKEYIQLLISKRDIWDILENLYSNEENYINKIKEQIKKEFETENIKEILKTFQENLKINLERKINDIKQKANLKEKDIDIIIDEIEKVCEEDLDEDRYSIENIFSKKDKSNIIEFLNKILELCAIKKYGKPATLIKYILKKGKYKLYEIEYKAVDYVDKLIKYIKKYIFEDEDIKNQFNFSKELFELAKKANEYSMEEKRKIGGIDYDDMLLLVRDLLKNSEIAKKVANDYLHILVDEFQDTNNIQYDIIKSIALRDGDDDKNPILFIVGDAKQSIYGFRNADVSLFNKVQEDIKELKQANKEDVNITLEETFRVPYNNSNFINLICNNIFGSLENEYKKLPDLEIKYNDLKVNQKNLDELDNDIDKIISPSGEVVILYTNIEKEDKNKENQSNESSKEEDEVQTVSDNKDEARQIAKYIKKIVKNYKIKDKETYRFIEYKDIGILFPKNKDISNLKDVFYEYNIPFNILKNNDFIQQPEVIDLLNYLKFINLPSNDLALFGVLYSPFFGFTTKELNEIAKILSKIKKETNQTKVSFIKDSLWENLKELNSNNDKYYNIIDNQLLDKIKKAVETLSEMLKIYSTASISHLLRVIIKKFNWNGYFVKNSDKISTIKKIKYNIDLFVAKARSFQETNFITLAEFIKYIESNTDSDFEAYNIEDAVSLLTIHSAKGTEFPVVFLYSINTKFHNSRVPFIDKRYGLTFKTKIKNIDEKEEDEDNIVTTLAGKLEDISSKAEYNRLIYVALTRAKNLLIISIASSIASNIKDDKIQLKGYAKTILETGCASLISKIKGLQKEDCKEEELYKDNNIDVRIIKNVTEDKNDISVIDNNDKIESKEIIVPKNKIDFFYIKDNRVSASKLMRLENNIIKYNVLKHKQDKEGNENQLTAIEKGLWYHRIFENINKWLIVNEESGENKIDKKKFLEVYNDIEYGNQDKLEEDKVLEEAEIIIQKDFIKKSLKFFKDAKFEYELNLALNEKEEDSEYYFLTAKFDLLIQNDKGEWELWDWKTNKLDAENIDKSIEGIRLSYEMQSKVYCFLLMNSYPTQKEYIFRLILLEQCKLQDINNYNEYVIEYKYSIDDKENLKQEIIEKIKGAYIKVKL